jgi:hypothetical protein
VLPQLLAHHHLSGVGVIHIERPHEIPGQVALVVVGFNAVAPHVSVSVFDDAECAVSDLPGGERFAGCFDSVADPVDVVEPGSGTVAVRLGLPGWCFDRVAR